MEQHQKINHYWLHFLSRLMFWTVWGVNDAKIERATMAGDDRSALWSGKESIAWPNGLTIDYLEERVYWAGAK